MTDEAQPANQAPDPRPQTQPPAGTGPSSPLPPGPTIPRVPPPPGSARVPAPAAQARQDAAAQAAQRRAERQRRRRRFWSLLLLALAGVAIAFLLYIIVPPLFDRFVDPLAANNAAVRRLESRFEALRNEQNAALVEQQAAILDVQDEAAARVASAEERLAAAEGRLRDAEDTLAAQEQRVTELENTLGQTVMQLEAATAQLAALEADLPGATEYGEFNYQLMLIRAWQDTLRARLRLFENNAGLAEEDLSRALGTLQAVSAAGMPEQQAALGPVIERMQTALESVQTAPFDAAADLEVAWNSLGELIQPVTIREQAPAAPAEEAEPPTEDEEAPDAAEPAP